MMMTEDAMKACPWPIEELLPHAAPMIFLDRVISYSETGVLAELTIRPDHPLARTAGVAGHVGIELMAQSCGAHAGAKGLAQGIPAKIGFLLGTRRYRVDRDWFAFGDVLHIRSVCTFLDDGMGVYDCRIEIDGSLVAEAQINVYQPENAAAFFASTKGQLEE